jgi:hypothetical protein
LAGLLLAHRHSLLEALHTLIWGLRHAAVTIFSEWCSLSLGRIEIWERHIEIRRIEYHVVKVSIRYLKSLETDLRYSERRLKVTKIFAE